jgi:hypothetical protein
MPEFLRLPMTYDRDPEIMQHATLSNHLSKSLRYLFKFFYYKKFKKKLNQKTPLSTTQIFNKTILT